MKRHFFTGIKLLLLFTFLTGLIFPLIITLFAQIVFPYKASGSIIIKGELAAGSELIAQKFESNKYFKPRPSAIDFKPMPSGASNLSQASLVLKTNYDSRKKVFLDENFLNSSYNVPKEMLFTSASGVDPHISPEAAYAQVERISKARNMNDLLKQKMYKLIRSRIESPQFGFLGERVINVLLLNLELDKIAQ